MAMLRKFFAPGGNINVASTVDAITTLPHESSTPSTPGLDEEEKKVSPPVPSDAEAAAPTADAQAGVQGVEAVTLTWNKATLTLVYIKYVFE